MYNMLNSTTCKILILEDENRTIFILVIVIDVRIEDVIIINIQSIVSISV